MNLYSITGKITSLPHPDFDNYTKSGKNYLLANNNGMEYLLLVSKKTYYFFEDSSIPMVEKTAPRKIYVRAITTAAGVETVCGFATLSEVEFFTELTTSLASVGATTAIKILSVTSKEEIIKASKMSDSNHILAIREELLDCSLSKKVVDAVITKYATNGNTKSNS